jgi:hypothetical protein
VNIKKPKLGDMVRVTYKDNASVWRQPYLEIFSDGDALIARGRFIGSVNGRWYIEATNFIDDDIQTNNTSIIIESCITEVKNFGHDDSPLPEDLETLLKEAKEEK